MTRSEIEKLTLDFTAAFNRDDLDGVMSYFAVDGVYDQVGGERAVGTAAVRAAFAPQLQGAYGTMRFIQEDIFVDADAAKSMISWTCTFETKRGPAGWRGLDLLHWKDGKLVHKLTYAKAKQLLLQS